MKLFQMALLFLLLAGCGWNVEQQNGEYQERVKKWSADTERRVEQLEAKVKELTLDAKILYKRIDEQTNHIHAPDWLLHKQVQQLNRNWVFLDANESEFYPAKTELGLFYIKCAGAVQYLDGHKVKVSIGNPYSAHFSGIKLSGHYGEGSDTKSFEKEFPSTIKPSSWNEVELILSPSTAQDLKEIMLRLDLDTLSLPTQEK